MNAATSTSMSFFARLLAGLDLTNHDPEQPDISADEITTVDNKISARLFTPSGDAYCVTVEWLSEASP